MKINSILNSKLFLSATFTTLDGFIFNDLNKKIIIWSLNDWNLNGSYKKETLCISFLDEYDNFEYYDELGICITNLLLMSPRTRRFCFGKTYKILLNTDKRDAEKFLTYTEDLINLNYWRY